MDARVGLAAETVEAPEELDADDDAYGASEAGAAARAGAADGAVAARAGTVAEAAEVHVEGPEAEDCTDAAVDAAVVAVEEHAEEAVAKGCVPIEAADAPEADDDRSSHEAWATPSTCLTMECKKP